MALGTLLDLLVPPRCAACGAAAGGPVCASCRRAIPWLRGGRCPRCALPLAAHRRCPARGQAFAAAWAPVAYEGVARELVAALKFRHGRPLAAVLAAHIAAGLPRDLAAGAVIVPVPAHPAHARGRGYDQAELLARELARRIEAPLGRPLRRRGPATRQLGAGRAERLRQGRIAITARAAPERVLLVDDVHTTGATLDACAHALRAAGTRHVSAVSWARAVPR
jgi:predicted amidophosphoribosyltransferase